MDDHWCVWALGRTRKKMFIRELRHLKQSALSC
jgi:hypothetical protein